MKHYIVFTLLILVVFVFCNIREAYKFNIIITYGMGKNILTRIPITKENIIKLAQCKIDFIKVFPKQYSLMAGDNFTNKKKI